MNSRDQIHDDHNDDDGGRDHIGDALTSAGRRLRAGAPDEASTRQALSRVTQRATTPPAPRRSPWPAFIGAGLIAAAIVGVIVVRSEQPESLAPVTSNPVVETDGTAPAPPTTSGPDATDPAATTGILPATGVDVEVVAGCITVTTAAGSATGCPGSNFEPGRADQPNERTFVADIDGPVLVTSSSADPLADLTATTDVGDFVAQCRWDDLAARIPAGSLIELVVCNETGVMGATLTSDPRADFTTSAFTLPTPELPDGTDLGAGTPIEGMPGALAFVTPVQDITTCSLLLLPDRSGWKESCGFDRGRASHAALVQFDPTDPTVYEIHVDGGDVITSAQALQQMAPSSGCTLDDANQLMRTLPSSSIVIGFGCAAFDGGDGPSGASGSLTIGSVLTQVGPPDGLIVLAERDDPSGVWTITDSGTGIDDAFSFPIVSVDTWTTWPVATAPTASNWWSDAVGSIEPQQEIAGVAGGVISVLDAADVDPEFPPNARLIADEPDDLPLIVAQIDVGGDDSVGGAVVYIWVEQLFDANGPIGWQPAHVLAGNICRRGIAEGTNLCL